MNEPNGLQLVPNKTSPSNHHASNTRSIQLGQKKTGHISGGTYLKTGNGAILNPAFWASVLEWL
jgi:hypothetical protein